MAGQLTIDTLKASSGILATQNGMTGIAKAWVSFGGTGTINSSFNVSSVTQNSTGQYTVNITTAFSSSSFVAVATPNSTNNSNAMVGNFTASTIGVYCQVATSAGYQNAGTFVVAYGA